MDDFPENNNHINNHVLAGGRGEKKKFIYHTPRLHKR